MASLFPNGVRGLADSKWSGVLGSAFRLVGLDIHSTPGVIKVHQKLSKHSGSTITELCKVGLPLSDGSRLWFSSESGKIWREVSGTYTLVHTTAEAGEPFSSPTQYTWLQRAENQKYVISDGSQTGLDIADDISIAAYIYFRSLPSSGETYTIVDKWQESGNNRSYKFTVELSGSNYILRFWTSINGQAGGASVMTATFSAAKLGEWIHVGVVRDRDATSGTVKFYVNGVEIASVNDLTGNNALYDSAASVGVGGSNELSTAGFDGYIADVRVWSRIVTDTEFGNLYANPVTFDNGTDLKAWWKFNGNALDETANDNDLTAQNSPTFRTFGTVVNVVGLDAEEFDGFVYYATEDKLRRIAMTNIASWSGNVQIYGFFAVTDDTYHPMEIQNLQLFIGDKTVIAKVDENHAFQAETNFTVKTPERITALGKIDTDILVGTLNVVRARVLRWDTESDSWGAEDEIPEKGVRAFIKDDNYVYALVGDFGRIYFYNGEKLETFTRVLGEWSPTKTGTIHHNAVGFLLGIPVFGFSNTTGNPALQGIYSLGSYDKNYPKTLDLSFPISSGEFSGLQIGAIVVDGGDLYASWKGAFSAGVDKLDYSAKYASAYLRSVQVVSKENRGFLKTLKEFRANYISLPANTDITLKYAVNYASNFTTIPSVKDTNLLQKRSRRSINKIGALELGADFTVSGNNAPEVEDFEYFFNNQKSKL